MEGRILAERNSILDKLRPIFDYVAGDRSPPPAPKHASSKPRAPRASAGNRKEPKGSQFNAINQPRSMGPPSFPLEHHDVDHGVDEDESIEQTTLESSSMMADEEMPPPSQHGPYSRKRKRAVNDATAMSIREQEHILYGDQLLDYFMTVGDAPEATRIPPPEPPLNFQVDRPIDDSGNTALHWACAMGDLEIVKDLLRRGADVKALSIHEETPLVRAVLFTNNYEKRTFPELLELLLDTISFRDWFGATVFHHVAETTRSKGKWKSSRYYCEVLLETLRNSCPQEDIDLLLSCQDSNDDTAALVAARNGAFRLVNLLLLYCPRAGDLVNKKGETATGIVAQAHHPEQDIPPPPSSVIMGNDQLDGEFPRPVSSDQLLTGQLQSSSAATSALMTKIESIMVEANKRLAVTYGSSKTEQADPDDVANPETLYEQLELDRQKVQRQLAALQAKEATGESVGKQLQRYEQLRADYESLLERAQHDNLVGRVTSGASSAVAEKRMSSSTGQPDLFTVYQLSKQLYSAQKRRRAAVKDLVQQTADAGVSTKFDVHRKLVSLATGLREEELDPMSAELAETLEFERMNGKGSGPESPEPGHGRRPSRRESTPVPIASGSTVSVDA